MKSIETGGFQSHTSSDQVTSTMGFVTFGFKAVAALAAPPHAWLVGATQGAGAAAEMDPLLGASAPPLNLGISWHFWTFWLAFGLNSRPKP